MFIFGCLLSSRPCVSQEFRGPLPASTACACVVQGSKQQLVVFQARGSKSHLPRCLSGMRWAMYFVCTDGNRPHAACPVSFLSLLPASCGRRTRAGPWLPSPSVSGTRLHDIEQTAFSLWRCSVSPVFCFSRFHDCSFPLSTPALFTSPDSRVMDPNAVSGRHRAVERRSIPSKQTK